MAEIFNRVTFILLLIAVLVTALGTFVSLEKYLGFQDNGSWLTGAASSPATGETNLTILTSVSLTNQRGQIDFGSGNVNSSCNFCGMDSNGQNISYYANGSNFSGLGGLPNSQCCVSFNSTQGVGFLLENTGNVNLSVGYTCSGNCTHALFIGGDLAPGMGGIQIKATPNAGDGQAGESGVTDTSGSCQGGGAAVGFNSWNITNSSSYINQSSYGLVGNSTYTVLSPAGHWLCGNATQFLLDSDNSKDAAVIDINITIPSNAPATGIRSSFRLTFNGTSS